MGAGSDVMPNLTAFQHSPHCFPHLIGIIWKTVGISVYALSATGFTSCTLVQMSYKIVVPMARPSLKLCMPSPMMTIQAMLAIPASFISWSEWQFPPWEWPCPCECPCFLVLRPFSLVGDWRRFEGASGVLLVGESGVWSSVSCVSLWLLSQETAVLSGSGRGRKC